MLQLSYDCLLAALAAGVMVIILIFQIYKSSSRNLPGPWGLPVFGYYFFLGTQPHLKLTELGRKYGPVFGMKVGLWSVVVLNDRKHAMDVFKHESFSDRPSFRINDMLGAANFSFLSYTEPWKDHIITVRRLWTKFVKEAEVLLQDIINSEVRLILEKLQTRDDSKLVDHIRLSASSVVFQMVYGRDKNIYSRPDFIHFLRIYSTIGTFPSGENVFHFINFIPWLSRLMPEFERNSRTVFSTSQQLHTRKILASKKTFCFANYLLKESETSRVPEYVFGSLEAIFGASVFNPTTGLMNVLALLAQYPDVQHRVRQELSIVVDPPTWNDRVKLPFTESVILESLRLRPPDTLTLPHRARKDTFLDGYKIKQGSLFVLNIYAAHFDENDWANPKMFQADRFLNEKGEVDHTVRCKLLSFSCGRRQCFGQVFAVKEVFLFLTGLLQKCVIEQDGENEIKLRII